MLCDAMLRGRETHSAATILSLHIRAVCSHFHTSTYNSYCQYVNNNFLSNTTIKVTSMIQQLTSGTLFFCSLAGVANSLSHTWLVLPSHLPSHLHSHPDIFLYPAHPSVAFSVSHLGSPQ